MQLEQLIWGLTALGALATGAAAALLAFGRDRVREPGIAVLMLVTGLLFTAGGFLLSIPRYAATGAIAAGSALVGVLVGIAWARGGKSRPARPPRGQASNRPRSSA